MTGLNPQESHTRTITMPRISESGVTWLNSVLCSMTWEVSFYGLFAAVALMSSWILIQKGLLASRARMCLFFVNVVMFSLSTAHIVLSVKFYLIQFPTLTSDLVEDNPEWMLKQLNKWYTDLTVMRRVSYLISDAVVVWRTWCIWHDNRWVKIYLAVVLFATAATSIACAVIVGIRLPVDGLVTNMLGTFCLLVTNFSTTILCGYKVWEYRRFIKGAFGDRHRNSLVENVLLILVESGSLYCIFWLLFLLGDFGYFSSGPLGSAFGLEWFMPHFSGIYTSLIILVVAMSRSQSDTLFTGVIEQGLQTHGQGLDIEKRGQVDSIRFATRPLTTLDLAATTHDDGSGADTTVISRGPDSSLENEGSDSESERARK